MNVNDLLRLPVEDTSEDLNQMFLGYSLSAFPELDEMLQDFELKFTAQEKMSVGNWKGKVRVHILILKDHSFNGHDSSYSWGMRVIKFLGIPVMVIQNAGKGDSRVSRTIINAEGYRLLVQHLVTLVADQYTFNVAQVDPQLDVPDFESFCGHGISDTGWEYKDA